jgi:hypothetical protein
MSVILLALAVLLGSVSQAGPLPVPTPIGAEPGFRPPAVTPRILSGLPVGGMTCQQVGGAEFRVHVELFARGRVVLLPAGIGVAAPRRAVDGFVTPLGCSYPLRTVDPTGVVRVKSGTRYTLGDVFGVWNQRLGRYTLLGFHSRRPVRAFVDGRRWSGDPRSIPLRPRSEIVVEIGRLVVPHADYLFPGEG